MCFKRFILLAVLCPLMLLVSCGKKTDDSNATARWGKGNYSGAPALTINRG